MTLHLLDGGLVTGSPVALAGSAPHVQAIHRQIEDARRAESVAAVLLLRTPAGEDTLGPTARPVKVGRFSTAVEQTADAAWNEGQTPVTYAARWLVERARERYWQAAALSAETQFRKLRKAMAVYVGPEDAEQDVMMALVRAARYYDPTKGPFRRYATMWIWTAFRLRDDQHGLSVSQRDAARIAAGDEARVHRAADDPDAEAVDGDQDDAVRRLWLRRELGRAMDVELTADERTALCRYYGIEDAAAGVLGASAGMTVVQVGRSMNRSEDTVRSLRQRAEGKLRAWLDRTMVE